MIYFNFFIGKVLSYKIHQEEKEFRFVIPLDDMFHMLCSKRTTIAKAFIFKLFCSVRRERKKIGISFSCSIILINYNGNQMSSKKNRLKILLCIGARLNFANKPDLSFYLKNSNSPTKVKENNTEFKFEAMIISLFYLRDRIFFL